MSKKSKKGDQQKPREEHMYATTKGPLDQLIMMVGPNEISFCVTR